MVFNEILIEIGKKSTYWNEKGRFSLIQFLTHFLSVIISSKMKFEYFIYGI